MCCPLRAGEQSDACQSDVQSTAFRSGNANHFEKCMRSVELHAHVVMSKFTGFLLPFIVILAVPGCNRKAPRAVQAGTYTLRVADGLLERMKGLQGVREISTRTGMVFILPAGTKAVLWMKGCLVAMDMVFLDASGKVQAVVHATPPSREGPLLRYTAVGPMAPSLVDQAVLPVSAYVVEVREGEGTTFAQEAHLLPAALAGE